MRVSRIVDLLGRRVGTAKIGADGKPVLNRENGKHRGRFQVAQQNTAAYFGGRGGRSDTGESKLIMEIAVGQLGVTLPPQTNRGHVVCGS